MVDLPLTKYVTRLLSHYRIVIGGIFVGSFFLFFLVPYTVWYWFDPCLGIVP